MRYFYSIPYLLLSSVIFLNCSSKNNEILEIQEYTGPVLEMGPAITYYSDSAVVKMKMEAPKQLEFGNGDREFPEGLSMEFFDKQGNPTSTLRADYCYYTRKEDLYKATGNVVVKNLENNDRLDTEELFWNEKKEDVFTEKFVRIEKDGDIQVGEGLKAKQDFSYWEILNSKGEITLDE
jgi:LPS export ABC transporter protein LptC